MKKEIKLIVDGPEVCVFEGSVSVSDLQKQTLGERTKARRLELGLTVQDVAERPEEGLLISLE